MEHKITLGEIEGGVFTFPLAGSTENTNESKDLRLVMANGEINYVVRYFKNGALKQASKPVPFLSAAVDIYNTL